MYLCTKRLIIDYCTTRLNCILCRIVEPSQSGFRRLAQLSEQVQRTIVFPSRVSTTTEHALLYIVNDKRLPIPSLEVRGKIRYFPAWTLCFSVNTPETAVDSFVVVTDGPTAESFDESRYKAKLTGTRAPTSTHWSRILRERPSLPFIGSLGIFELYQD